MKITAKWQDQNAYCSDRPLLPRSSKNPIETLYNPWEPKYQ